jgi:hypothetical protein
MADTVDVKAVFSGRRNKVYHLTNISDGTGESDVIKVDISALTAPGSNGPVTATYSAIDRIEYSVWGFNYVALEWDHTTDDEIAILQGQGVMDWSIAGGNVDPRSAGATGDIVLTTNGGAAGSGYDITIYFRLKA